MPVVSSANIFKHSSSQHVLDLLLLRQEPWQQRLFRLQRRREGVSAPFACHPLSGAAYPNLCSYGLSKDLVEEAGQQGAKMKKALEERRWLHFAFNGARNYFGVYHADAVSTEQKLGKLCFNASASI
jgi:hypothetical protein